MLNFLKIIIITAFKRAGKQILKKLFRGSCHLVFLCKHCVYRPWRKRVNPAQELILGPAISMMLVTYMDGLDPLMYVKALAAIALHF